MSNSAPLEFLAAHSKWEAAREAIQAFRSKHRAILDQEHLLKTQYNEALSETKKIYKTKAEDMPEKYGEFSIRGSTEIDVELLVSLMGKNPRIKEMVELVYKLDRDKYKSAVKSGFIPQDIIAKVESPGSKSVYGPKEA